MTSYMNTLEDVCAVQREEGGGGRGGRVQYNGAYSVRLRDTMSIPSHDKCGTGKTIEFVWKPQCTEHPLVYS